MKVKIDFKDRHTRVSAKDMERLKSFHYHQSQDSISKEDIDAFIKKRQRHRCPLCYNSDEERLKLFLLQDDRVYDSDNPMVVPHLNKAPIPKCKNRKLENKSKPKFFRNVRTARERKNHILDLNNQLINELNYEMDKFEGKTNLIDPTDDKHLLYGKTHKFYNTNKVIEEQKLQKIKEINPYIFKKKQKCIKRIPYILKNNRPWSGMHKCKDSINGKFFSQENMNEIEGKKSPKMKKDDSFTVSFTKKKVNIEDVLAIHNSTIRKGFRQSKVSNSVFRQNLKLKNSHLFTPDIKSNLFSSPFEKANIVYMKLY